MVPVRCIEKALRELRNTSNPFVYRGLRAELLSLLYFHYKSKLSPLCFRERIRGVEMDLVLSDISDFSSKRLYSLSPRERIDEVTKLGGKKLIFVEVKTIAVEGFVEARLSINQKKRFRLLPDLWCNKDDVEIHYLGSFVAKDKIQFLEVDFW